MSDLRSEIRDIHSKLDQILARPTCNLRHHRRRLNDQRRDTVRPRFRRDPRARIAATVPA